jgi:hypothetical protein
LGKLEIAAAANENADLLGHVPLRMSQLC